MSRFHLGISHLLNFERALAALASDDLFSSHASLAALTRTDDQLHELGVIDVLVAHE